MSILNPSSVLLSSAHRAPKYAIQDRQSDKESTVSCLSIVQFSRHWVRTYAITNCVSPFALVRIFSVASAPFIRFVMNTTSPDVISMPATSEFARAHTNRGTFGRRSGRLDTSFTMGKLDSRAIVACRTVQSTFFSNIYKCYYLPQHTTVRMSSPGSSIPPIWK
jgi:hypothetical protein